MTAVENAGLRFDPAAGSGGSRFAAVDAARGVALAAMAVYHFAWDLAFVRLVATDVAHDPGWRVFAWAIAGSFLFLVGVSLVLAHRRGLRLRPFLRRLMMIVAAAALVTVATWFAFPDAFIFFGILHSIAAGSVLGLAFLRAPVWLVLAAAAVVLALPHVAAWPAFDHPALLWTGLGATIPYTNDYVPVFPWFGMVLAGIAAARIALASGFATSPAAGWRGEGRLGRVLVWSGRHSLAIYLIHQPVLFVVAFLIAQAVGPLPHVEETRFERSCTATCVGAGAERALCRASCACLVDELQAAGMWDDTVAATLTEDERARVGALAGACRVRAADDALSR